MANIYTSDSFDIEEAYATNWVTDEIADGGVLTSTNQWFLLVQRKPTSQYPEKTEIVIEHSDMAVTVTESTFLSTAPGLVTSKLSEYDSQSEFTGNTFVDTARASSEYTQKFNT